mmetsp:Transcript_22793/g.75603  ORF Transcript_22793/g.75603 Transcript_22793/m.75603 type:complete len:308 (-) Transcript_22793:925-1848(-)
MHGGEGRRSPPPPSPRPHHRRRRRRRTPGLHQRSRQARRRAGQTRCRHARQRRACHRRRCGTGGVVCVDGVGWLPQLSRSIVCEELQRLVAPRQPGREQARRRKQRLQVDGVRADVGRAVGCRHPAVQRRQPRLECVQLRLQILDALRPRRDGGLPAEASGGEAAAAKAERRNDARGHHGGGRARRAAELSRGGRGGGGQGGARRRDERPHHLGRDGRGGRYGGDVGCRLGGEDSPQHELGQDGAELHRVRQLGLLKHRPQVSDALVHLVEVLQQLWRWRAAAAAAVARRRPTLGLSTSRPDPGEKL